LESPSDKEIRESIEYVKGKMADPAKFEEWANDLLDRAHNVDRKSRR
jgi:hypothetical protein